MGDGLPSPGPRSAGVRSAETRSAVLVRIGAPTCDEVTAFTIASSLPCGTVSSVRNRARRGTSRYHAWHGVRPREGGQTAGVSRIHSNTVSAKCLVRWYLRSNVAGGSDIPGDPRAAAPKTLTAQRRRGQPSGGRDGTPARRDSTPARRDGTRGPGQRVHAQAPENASTLRRLKCGARQDVRDGAPGHVLAMGPRWQRRTGQARQGARPDRGLGRRGGARRAGGDFAGGRGYQRRLAMTEHGYVMTSLLGVSRIAFRLASGGGSGVAPVSRKIPGRVTAVCGLQLNERLCRHSLQNLTGACGEPLQWLQGSYLAWRRPGNWTGGPGPAGERWA